jgi:hypothetical protein
MKTLATRMTVGMGLCLLVGPVLAAQDVSFPVRHKHMLRDGQGELIFSTAGVEYRAKEKKHGRTWKYVDIQQIGLLGPKVVAIVTYEDAGWKFDKDRIYNFEITAGEITPALWSMLQGRLTRPLVSAVIPPDVVAKFSIPVKHLRGFGGSQGTLEFTDQYVVYRTAAPQDARIWRYQDISAIGSTGPYQLRLTTMDRVNGESGAERNFVFSLKQRLADDAYDFAWWKINGPQIEPAVRK